MTALTIEAGRERSAMQGFHRALTREILVTEQLRIKAVLATILLFAVALTVMHLIFPDSMERIWRGQFELWKFYVVAVPLVIFEVTVLWLIKRHIALNHDVPVLRRYLSALIETSLPTIALAIHMNAMGPERALGFAAPLAYFVFIILSTLRLDFWLSTFTGLVAAVELFAMAMLYHPVGICCRGGAGAGLQYRPQHPAGGWRRARRRGRSAVAPPVRGQHRCLDRARPRHQSVRAARLAAGGGAAAGGRGRRHQRGPPCRHHVRRFPQFYRGGEGAHAAGKSSTGSTACSRCWSISWTGTMAS